MVGPSFRAYSALVGLFAVWVGAWGFLAPAEIERALPWKVPPLHARFIAAMYLAGALAMAWSLFARTLAEVRIPIALAALWTGALLLVSLRQLDAFDFAKPQVWFWIGAYAVYPLWGAWLYTRAASHASRRALKNDPALLVLGALCLLFGAALLLAPGAMVGAWPWAVSPLLANIYAGPFLAWGIAAILLAGESAPAARRIVLASMLAFALLALLASLLHLRLFRFEGPSAWVWFGGFVVVAVLLAARLLAPRRTA